MGQVTSLRGQLLVAGPALVDPNFRRTVVLIGEHGDEGAMGVVLNRVSDDARRGGRSADGLAHRARRAGLLGGPVQPEAVVVLADFADVEQAEVAVVDSIGFLPGEIEDTSAVGELRGVRVFAGYAGWGPGQLEDELEEGAWIVVHRSQLGCLHDRAGARSGATSSAAKAARSRSLALLPDDPRVN